MVILVVERNDDGEFYLYTETAEHYCLVGHRNSCRSWDNWRYINAEMDYACHLPELLNPGEWTSFILKEFP
jgi:hypothetical protein